MNQFAEHRLGDFFRIKHGYAVKSAFFAKEGDFIVLTPGNFKEDGGLKSQGEKEKFYSADPPTDFILRSGDLLTVMTDLTQEARILGASAFVREDGRLLHNQRLGKVVDLDIQRLDKTYLYHLFNWSKVRDQLRGSATGSTVRHTAPDRIYAVTVPLPSLATQQRIAAILSAYDELIENNTRRIAILEEMARRLYYEWFVRFRFPGHEAAEFDGELPLGWRSVELGDVVEERRDSVKPDEIDPQTPYVGLEHIPRRSITLREWSSASTVQSTKLRFADNDILFGKIRPYFHKVSLAPVAGVASSDTIILRAYSPEHLPLTLCCASSDAFVDHATQTSNGTKMPRANWNVLTKYPVVIPDAQVLCGFNGFVQPLLSQLTLLNRKNANLRTQRDLLLPKLVSGEIDVSGAEVVLEAAE